jgi:MFS family permease
MTLTESNTTYDEKLIDKITNQYGYGVIVYKTFFLVFLIASLEGFHFTYFGNMFISLTNFYNMEDSYISIISSIFFLAVGGGSILSGFLTERIKRITIINISIILLSIAHLTLGFITNIILFAIVRTCIAITCGILIPPAANLLAEYLPVQKRAIMLTGVWLGFTFGQLVNLVLMFIIMPNNETDKYQETVLFSSILSIVTLASVLFLLNDSPRNLISTDQTETAFKILDRLNGQQLTDGEKEIILSEYKSGINNEIKTSILEIFSPDLRKTTILLMFIWAFNSLLYFGPVLISSVTMERLNIQSDNLISKQIVIALIGWPSDLLGGFACELPLLGRNKTANLALLLAIVFNVLLMVNSSNFEYHFGIFMLFIGLTFDVSKTYACEIYPTKVRDLAMGFLYFCTRAGGFLSQILFIQFNKLGLWVPYFVTIGICCAGIGLRFLLPVDTYSRPLDAEINKSSPVQQVDEKLI